MDSVKDDAGGRSSRTPCSVEDAHAHERQVGNRDQQRDRGNNRGRGGASPPDGASTPWLSDCRYQPGSDASTAAIPTLLVERERDVDDGFIEAADARRFARQEVDPIKTG